MSKKAIIGTGIILFIILAILCSLFHGRRIENNLLQEAKALFTENGLPEDIIEFDGRDAILKGQIASPEIREQAMTILSGMPGVRKIIDQSSIRADEGLPPALEMEFRDGKVIFNGRLPDKGTLDRLLDLAAKKFGAANVINNITIDESLSSPDWLSNIPDIFSLLANHLTKGSFTFDGSVMGLLPGQLSGINLDDLLKQLKGLLPEGIRTSIEETTIEEPVAKELTHSEMQQKIDDLLTKTPLHFETASDVLSGTTQNTLTALAAILNLNKNIPISVIGHADSRGTLAFNQTLSEKRANAVSRFLQRNGIEQSRMTTLGKGETEPIADNATAAGQQKNRRVEIHVKEGN